MEKVSMDERGRLTMPKEIRERMRARSFTVVYSGHTVILHPVPKDPVAHWREVWKGVKFKSLEEEARETEELIKQDIIGKRHVRRH